MEALDGLVKAGKVRAIGASAMYGYQFYNMQLAAKERGLTPFATMENHYNLLYREDERELIPICKQMNVALMPYSPLAAGHLSRPVWNTDSLRSQTDRVAHGKYDRMEEPESLELSKKIRHRALCCWMRKSNYFPTTSAKYPQSQIGDAKLFSRYSRISASS